MRRTYVFVLSPPFSGSTLLYRLLGTSAHASTLFGHGNWAGEGQSLPSVSPLMRITRGNDPRIGGFWDPAVQMPWERIKPEWDKYWDLSKPILVEKSPPNLCRAESLAEYFGRFGEVAFVGLIRSPYAVKQSAERWVEQAEFQQRNQAVLPNFLLVTYEDLCADPAGVAARISAHVPGLGPLDPHLTAMAGVVAGERGEELENKNELTVSLVERRNTVLAPREELLRAFGYELLRPGTAAWAAADFRPELEIRARLEAPRAEVYRAWTEQERLARWWSHAELAGARLAWTVAGKPPVTVHGVLQDAVFGERLRFTHEISRQHVVLDDTVVEVELGDAGAATDVVVRELRVHRSRTEESRRFWTDRLAALAAALTVR